MKLVEEMILAKGEVYPGEILKVDSFLNHQLDPMLYTEMGKEIARLFAADEITKILTIEASGIALALAAAQEMQVPAVFAKKNKTKNLAGDIYTTVVQSYTHGIAYGVMVAKKFIQPQDKILIVDDFLAKGAAMEGLISLVEQGGAQVVGCVAAIEKGFQDGGARLRERGYRVESLAIVESMSEHGLTFREQ